MATKEEVLYASIELAFQGLEVDQGWLTQAVEDRETLKVGIEDFYTITQQAAKNAGFNWEEVEKIVERAVNKKRKKKKR
jgi:hypothetical protein